MLDADIYGPSMPRLLGISGKPADGRRQDAPADERTASRSCRWASSSTRTRR
jgi:Mrp family chromosome partitioning ATPase